MPFGLFQLAIDQIVAVFKRHPEVDCVILYGSRAKGTQKNGSDIDLVCEGQSITHSQLNRLHHELDELLLPYTIDLANMETISNPELRDHICRVGEIFYRQNT
jgi:uncharacterized protein